MRGQYHGTFSINTGYAGSSKILKRNLIFDVDFTNPKCYNRGSSVFDLTDRKAVLIPIGSATYNKNYGGAFQSTSAGSISQKFYTNVTTGITSNHILPQYTMSMSVWLRTYTRRSTAERYFRIANESFAIRHNGSTLGQLDCYVYVNNFVNLIRVQLNGQILNNTLYNIVATWDGNNLKVYKNGILVGTGTRSGVNVLSTYGGFYDIGFNGVEYLNGEVYRASAYDCVLSANDIEFNYVSMLNKLS